MSKPTKKIPLGSSEYVKNKIFDTLEQRCITQRQLADGIGVSIFVISQWKSGHTQSYMNRIGDIAKFFHLPVEALTGVNAQDNPANDSEIREYLEELKSRSEMRTLFKISKGATKEDIEKAIDILKALKK